MVKSIERRRRDRSTNLPCAPAFLLKKKEKITQPPLFLLFFIDTRQNQSWSNPNITLFNLFSLCFHHFHLYQQKNQPKYHFHLLPWQHCHQSRQHHRKRHNFQSIAYHQQQQPISFLAKSFKTVTWTPKPTMSSSNYLFFPTVASLATTTSTVSSTNKPPRQV